MAGLSSALAQAPPPVPALPDTERITQYTISSSTCACAVGFQLYGDQTDVDNWVKVLINGQAVLSTDPTFGWVLSSPTGSLSTIPRPITDAILTFNSPHTAVVQIVGAERPRRLATFAENQGVSARQLNQVINTLFAELRESWDRVGVPLASIQVPVRSASASIVTASATTDYFLCLDTSINPITLNLPASPGVGLSFLVKDCTGHAALNNITVIPASGTIDGLGVASINANYQSIAVTYTGTQWSIN
jgi:hypothetical protein